MTTALFFPIINHFAFRTIGSIRIFLDNNNNNKGVKIKFLWNSWK